MAVPLIWANPLVRAAAGVAVGFTAGELANIMYRGCSEEQQLEWKRNRVMHHGEFGALAGAAATGVKSPFWGCVGLGLMLSDINDLDEWFDYRRDKRGEWAEQVAPRVMRAMQGVRTALP